MKTFLIVILASAVLFLADRVVREENQRYALWLGMCRDRDGMTSEECLGTTQTRTSWFWQFYYATTEALPPVALTNR
jgi:hypothetical protein